MFYIWCGKEVEFHRCNVCGCMTHYVTTEKCDVDVVAVNMSCLLYTSDAADD